MANLRKQIIFQGGRSMYIKAKCRALIVFAFVLMLTLTSVGVVAAQDGDGGDEEAKFEHPVVAAFRAYFGDEVAEAVIVYHQDGGGGGEDGGLGYGVLVKLYAIAAESQEACVGTDEPCGVTVEELMAAHKSGVGLGQLFKQYGKPSMLGVGHLKNADKDGPPEHAGPKDKDKNAPPEHAGPKDKEKNAPPEHAGPKDKDK
jgi:hypothetical protein